MLLYIYKQMREKQMKNFIASVTFISALYIAPITVVGITILALIGLQFIDTVAGNTAIWNETPTTNIIEKQPDDLWLEDVEAREIEEELQTYTMDYQLALPPASTNTLADFVELTYKELQNLCKEKRQHTSDIRLTAKKDVLIDWLVNNA